MLNTAIIIVCGLKSPRQKLECEVRMETLIDSVSHKKIANQRGFSIVELLITGLVIAIVAVVAVPQIQKNLQLYRAESSVRIINDSVMEAKLLAIKWNRLCWLELDPNDNSVVIRTNDAGGSPISLTAKRFLSPETTIDSGSILSVSFTSLGRNQSASSTTIPLKFPMIEQCKEVKVSPLGKVSVLQCSYS